MDIIEKLKNFQAVFTSGSYANIFQELINDAEYLKKNNSELRSEVKMLEAGSDDLLDQIKDNNNDYSNKHDLGIGDIKWSSSSYELSELFELVCEKVTATSHKKVTSLLNAL